MRPFTKENHPAGYMLQTDPAMLTYVSFPQVEVFTAKTHYPQNLFPVRVFQS